MRNLSKGTDLEDCATEEKLDLEIKQLDVTDPDSVTNCLNNPEELDVLINNAGFEVQAAEQIDDETMLKQLETNVLGPSDNAGSHPDLERTWKRSHCKCKQHRGKSCFPI